jgi:hypothetical protein
VVERHENDDQPAQGIEGKKTIALCFFHLQHLNYGLI